MSIKSLNHVDFDCIEYTAEKREFRVISSDLNHYIEQYRELSDMIGRKKAEYAKKNNYSYDMANERLEEDCCIPIDTLRKTILGTTKCSRNFLYKFCVGLHMSLEEANKFFILCDGELNERCMADYICIKALEDRDTIKDFIDQFEQHVGIKLIRKRRE